MTWFRILIGSMMKKQLIYDQWVNDQGYKLSNFNISLFTFGEVTK